MDDLISRQAAIEALWKALYEYEDKTEKQFIDSEELDVADWIQHRIFVQNMNDIDRQTILNLPSAQPEPCEDAVSRKAVYDAMVEKGQRSRRYKLGEIWELNGTEIREALDTVPSVTPEQKRGKWINGYCSECGKHAPFWAMASTYYESSFCPNCGADMRGEQDG